MFKKLKGQVEVSKVKGETKAMSKSDKKKLEEQIIFGGIVNEFEVDILEAVSSDEFKKMVKDYPKDQPGVAEKIKKMDMSTGASNELLRDVRGTIKAKGGKDAKNISKV
jgi:hypothetical protein